MIERIKTVTWEVKSHGHKTTLSNEGVVQGAFCISLGIGWDNIRKPIIKKLVWHLQDVLKCMRQIEKEKQARKEKANENLPDEK